MYKKFITACMALVAFAAFVLPASASATSPELTNASGATVAKGTKITATNTNETFFKGSFGEVRCSNADLTGEVTKNEGKGEAIEGTVTSASFTGTGTSGDCTSTFGDVKVTTNVGNGTPWCMRALPGAAHELQIRGNSCANAARSITYVLDFTNIPFIGAVSCAYERTTLTGPVKGTYSTAPEDAEGAVALGAGSEFKLESGQSGACPASGSLEMTFLIREDVTLNTLVIS